MAKGIPARSSSRVTASRLLARDITREWREREAFVRELVQRYRVEGTGLAKEDFDYAQVLSFGVVMTYGTLDAFIDRNLNKPSDVKPKVRDCLRISAYELLFLEKPAHAVVDQGVELVRATAKKAAGLANAVLRKMVADAAAFPWGDPQASDEALAAKYGIAPWIATTLVAQYGRERATELFGVFLEAAPTYLVDNPYVPGQQFASDLSAQAVASLVPLDGEILEIGAGRGTKTALMQVRAHDELGRFASIHTVDVHAYKEELLKERLGEMGIEGVTTHTGDARDLASIEGLPASFDSVFVDAPCSGMGTLRRHPEIRWRMTPEGVEDLAALQLQLLEEAASRVKPGGTLVYATCSILSRENEEVVRRFLSGKLGGFFVMEDVAAGKGSIEGQIQDMGCLATLPTSHGPDGHFAAVFTRA